MKIIEVYKKNYFCIGVSLQTPYEDYGNEKYNQIHIDIPWFSIWINIPQIIKPKEKWVDTSNYGWSNNPNGGYIDYIQKQYGFSFLGQSLHINYGIQPGGWHSNDPENSDHTKVFWYPWNLEHKRTTFYSLDGSKSWTNTNDHESDWKDIRDLQYKFKNREESWDCYLEYSDIFKYETYIDPYDNKEIPVRYHIVEMEWRRFNCPFLKHIRRTIEIDFKDEVGPKKGSWKGGTIGMGFTMLPNESHEDAWKRFQKEGQ
jgi:hypothetical protein